MEQTTRARNKKIVKILITSLVLLIIGFIVFLFVWITWFMPPWELDGPQKNMIRLGNLLTDIDKEFLKYGAPECSPFSREGFEMGPYSEVFKSYAEGGSCEHYWEDGMKMNSKDYHTKRKKDFIVALKGERILLISVGPDGVLSVGEDEMRELFENPPEGESTESLSRDERIEEFLSRLEPYVYRATNGTGSNGDIFRLVTPWE